MDARQMLPTNNITTLDGRTVEARIDPSLTVNDVITQLCANLRIESPFRFVLKDETNQLVTDANLKRLIENRTNMKLATVQIMRKNQLATVVHFRNINCTS